MMPRASISFAEACPTAEATLQLADQRHQPFPVRHLEQLAVPHIGEQLLLFRSTTAIPTLTGPARAPRPTSSMPGEQPGAGAAEAAFVVKGGGNGHGGRLTLPAGPGRCGRRPGSCPGPRSGSAATR